MPLTLGFQGSLSERDTAVFVTLEEVPNGGGASSFVTYMTKTDYDGNWEIDLATAATYLGASKLLMEHRSTIKAIANAVDEAGNITAGSIATYIMQSDHNAGLLWPNPNELAISNLGSTDTAINHLVTDTTRDLIGGVDLLTGTEVMLTLSDNTGNTGTYTVFAQSDGRYTLDFEDNLTYTEETGSTFDMTALQHGATVSAVINSTDGLGNVYTYDSTTSDDGVQGDTSDDIAYEFEMSLEGPTLGTDNFVNAGTHELTAASGVTLSTYYDIQLGDWDGNGRDEIFGRTSGNNIDILFLNADGTEIISVEKLSTAHTERYGMTVGDFDGNGTDDVYANTTTNYSNTPSDYLFLNDPSTGTTKSTIIVQNASQGTAGSIAMDYNDDGNMDILFGSNASNSSAYLYLGNGSGGFSASINLGKLGGNNSWLGNDAFQRDFDNDGNLDTLFYGGMNIKYLHILFHDGNNGFVVSEYGAGTENGNLLFGDFDGDGQEEILARTSGIASLLSYDAATNTMVTEKTVIAGGGNFGDLWGQMTLDFDGDGDLDILSLASTGASGDLIVWYNDGAGNFTNGGDSGLDFDSENTSRRLDQFGDVNGSGVDEMILYDRDADKFNVIKNGNIAIPADGLNYFDNTNDTIRVFVTGAKAGDTIIITQNSNNIIDGINPYVLTQTDIDNGYADILVDLTNVNDGANVAFDITLTDSLGIYTIPTQTVEINVDARVPVAPAVDLDQGANDHYIIADPPVITGTHNNDFDYLRITVSDGTNTATYEPTFVDGAGGTWTLDIATATPLGNSGADPDYVDGGQININLSAHENTGSFTQATQTVDFDVSLTAPALGTDNFVNAGTHELTAASGVTLSTYYDIQLGDWDGNGRDEIFGRTSGNNIDILFLNADGTEIISVEKLSTAHTERYGMTVGDFDGNGTDDVYANTTTNYSNTPSDYLFLNDPSTGTTKSTIIVQNASQGTAGSIAMDYNDDGNMDILFGSNASNSSAYLYLGNGSGGFSASINLGKLGGNNSWLGNDAFQRDFDNDGNLDTLFYGGTNIKYLHILFHDGNNGFVVSEYGAGTENGNLLFGDFDGDGQEEILARTSGIASLLSYDAATNTMVTEKTVIAGGGNFGDLWGQMTLDFDGDGDLDILSLASTGASGDLIVWYNDGNGNFTNGGDSGLNFDSENTSRRLDQFGDVNGSGVDEMILYDRDADKFNVIKNGNIAMPADGSDSFDATNDQMRIFLQNVKVGDTIEITQNSNNVVNGGGTYVLTQADVDNGYADVELDFTNVADGTGIAFDITLTDTNIGRAPVTTTANIDVQPSATPIMAPTQPVYDAGDPLPVNDTVTNQPVGDTNGDGVIDAADNHEFTIWFKENASDPSAIEEDDIITFTNLATGEQSAASYVVTSADVQNGYANILAEFTTGISASTNLSDLQIQIEDHNTGNIVVFYGDHNQGNMYVHQAGSIATKHFIIDVDGDTDVIASGEFNVHTDSLDLGSLLNGFVRNTGNGDLWDDLEAQGFVKKSGTTDTTIEIDVNGTGNYTHAVTIEGIDSTNLDEDNLDL